MLRDVQAPSAPRHSVHSCKVMCPFIHLLTPQISTERQPTIRCWSGAVSKSDKYLSAGACGSAWILGAFCGSRAAHVCTRGAELAPGMAHAHRCVRTGPPVAPVRACAVWGLAPPWQCLPAPPICRECPGPGGAGRAGNLSQLLCPVSGKPPAGIPPQSPPALAPAPWASRKVPGGPASNPA